MASTLNRCRAALEQQGSGAVSSKSSRVILLVRCFDQFLPTCCTQDAAPAIDEAKQSPGDLATYNRLREVILQQVTRMELQLN